MFSFFRKGKDGDKPVVLGRGKPAATPAPAPTAKPPSDARPPAARPATPKPQVADTPAPSDGFLVQELDFRLAPEVEEAVMLYADGRTGDATAALNRCILNNANSRDPQPWRLLFDIYEITAQRQPFEDLAMDFAVRFERSPPTWRPELAAPSASAAGDHPTFSFGASLSPQDKAGLDHFMRECEASDQVELDFAKTPVPANDAYAKTILDCMARICAGGKAIQLVGGEAFAVRLNASRASDKLSEPAWLLLLLLLQLLGKADAFETAALDYAIRFEMSPPSYTPPKRVSAVPAAEDSAGPSGEIFPMRGPIGPGASAVFTELHQFAAALPVVEIDFSQVTRVEFTVVGLLMDTVMKLATAGKIVVFRDVNEMVALLLQMVGVGQFATVLPKVRK